MIGLMLFVSTSTFPYFGEMLARANISINEINEEENGNHSAKNKLGAYYSIDELHKFLSDYSTSLSSIVYSLAQYADYIPEVCTPPPQHIHIQST